MRVVIVGATGNVGTSLTRKLGGDEAITEIVGIARRKPNIQMPKTEWIEADVATADLASLFRGADAVVHLAWAIQPSHDLDALRTTNVFGSGRVFEAVGRAEVGALVYASSIGTYSPGPKSRRVDESWPTDGIPTSFYSRHKAEVERMLDRFEEAGSGVRVVRLRPALIFKREAATGIRRLFFGPLLPGFLLDPARLPLVPSLRRLIFQAVHTEDVAEAYRLAISSDVRGAFNIAAEPVIGPTELAEIFNARKLPIPARLLRALMHASWRLHLQPSPPGWLDMGLETPLMDVGRATRELGWKSERGSEEALLELFEGFAEGAGFGTPPLASSTTAPARAGEFRTGIGAKEGDLGSTDRA